METVAKDSHSPLRHSVPSHQDMTRQTKRVLTKELGTTLINSVQVCQKLSPKIIELKGTTVVNWLIWYLHNVSTQQPWFLPKLLLYHGSNTGAAPGTLSSWTENITSNICTSTPPQPSPTWTLKIFQLKEHSR